MFGQPLLVEVPHLAEAAIPQVQAPVGGEHADRLEQIVEGRGAHPEQGVARRRQADLLGAILEDHSQAAVGKRLRDHPPVVAARQNPILGESFLGRQEPVAPLVLPRRKVAHFGKPPILAHLLEQAVELGSFVERRRIDLGHRRERLVEERQGAIGIELRDRRGHPVGELALRQQILGEIEARVLEILDVDREAGHRAGRQRNVDQFEHPPLAADRRRLGADIGPPAFECSDRAGSGSIVAGAVDQLATERDHFGRIARLDRRDERRIDQPKAHVGAAIPHRKWRALDQVGQRIERGFGARQLVGELEPLGLGPGRVEQPQQQRAGGVRRRRQAPAHFDRAIGAGDLHLAGNGGAADRARLDIGLERLEIGRIDPQPIAREIVEMRRHCREAEVALEQGVAFDRPVGTDDQRAGRNRAQQRRHRARPTEQ